MSHTGMYNGSHFVRSELEHLQWGLDASGRARNMVAVLVSTVPLDWPKTSVHNASDEIASELRYHPARDTIFCQIFTLNLPQQHHYLLLLKELEHLRK